MLLKTRQAIKYLVAVLVVFFAGMLPTAQVWAYKTLGDKGTLAGAIPDCTKVGDCADVSIFVITLINLAKFLFSIIGAVFFLVLVYGGVVWMTAFGSQEKIKKGKDVVVAAFIGLVIAFTAYMLVHYASIALGVKSKYRL